MSRAFLRFPAGVGGAGFGVTFRPQLILLSLWEGVLLLAAGLGLGVALRRAGEREEGTMCVDQAGGGIYPLLFLCENRDG